MLGFFCVHLRTKKKKYFNVAYCGTWALYKIFCKIKPQLTFQAIEYLVTFCPSLSLFFSFLANENISTILTNQPLFKPLLKILDVWVHFPAIRSVNVVECGPKWDAAWIGEQILPPSPWWRASQQKAQGVGCNSAHLACAPSQVFFFGNLPSPQTEFGNVILTLLAWLIEVLFSFPHF